MYPSSNEIFSKAQMNRLIAAFNNEVIDDNAYPECNELPTKEQGEELIKAVQLFVSGQVIE